MSDLSVTLPKHESFLRELSDFEKTLLNKPSISSQLPVTAHGERNRSSTLESFSSWCATCDEKTDNDSITGEIYVYPDNCINIRAAFVCKGCGVINVINQRMRVLKYDTTVEAMMDSGDWGVARMVPASLWGRIKLWFRKAFDFSDE